MKIKLLSQPQDIPTKVQICLNRGVLPENLKKFLHNSMSEINDPTAFGEELLKSGVKLLLKAISENKDVIIIVDSDVDGWTSAAVLINYLYESFPAWAENHLNWALHEGKEHGLKDHIAALLECNYALVICPDSATNDTKEIDELYEDNTQVLILDHHLSDVPMSKNAVIINSQYNYPNPQLSGVGVVYQFCKYIDKLRNKNIADNFLDLVAIGLMGDMMDIRAMETKELMFKGFKEENLKNPLIVGLRDKSEFALSKADYIPSPDNDLGITPMGAAFFIIPLLNALSRSGTMEEKKLVFESMLTMKAFEKILSNKRGHKLGDMERRVDQALRTCTNVKNRQTRAEDAGMALLTSQAEEMLHNKVLVFTLEPGQIDPNIAGLVANKLQAKYQRPCCVTTRISMEDNTVYTGSMRGYTATGIDDFKAVAETSANCDWVRGHENAAGICLSNPRAFVDDMNDVLKDISTEIVYYVDYMWNANNVDGEAIIDMAEMNDYLGTGFSRPQVYVSDFEVNENNFMVMKSNTLKFTLPNGISIIKFAGTEEEIEQFKKGATISCVCKCNINEWNWERNPQLIMLDYEMKELNSLEMWGF